ncbi:MAG: hypothetical protein R8J85_09970, partial [Mariprofundales bacterium]
ELHIIEPTLINDAGHCFTVCSALADAVSRDGGAVQIWAGKQADHGLIAGNGVHCTPYFSRVLRRIQVHFLLRRLLRAGDTVLLPTAGRAELFAYALVPKRLRMRGKALFYVHQMRMDGKRAARLQWIARRAPEARILTTTDALAEVIRSAGFSQVQSQPCPFALPDAEPADTPFKQVIFPGMARMDKNLPLIADLIALMQQGAHAMPLLVQAGPNHHGEYAADIAALIEKIRHIGYPHLTMPGRAVNGEDYLAQFVGGVCLQPYVVAEYANKISGITLDALARGCPVIVRKGIWPATMVAQFDAGIVVDSDAAVDWLSAINAVVRHYSQYQQQCRLAYAWLREHHSADNLLATIRRMR